MKKERGNLLNLIFMMFHWILADATVLLGYLFQLAFPKDPDPETVAYCGKIYHANIPMFILGTLIMLLGYFLVWRLWLLDDWNRYKGKGKGWVFAGIMLELVNMVGLFVLFYLVMAMALRWGDYGDGSQWVNYSIIPTLVILIILPLWFFRKKNTQQKKEPDAT